MPRISGLCFTVEPQLHFDWDTVIQSISIFSRKSRLTATASRRLFRLWGSPRRFKIKTTLGLFLSPMETQSKNTSSVAHLFLVPDGKNGDIFPVEAIEGDIAAVAKVDQPFAKLGFHVFNRAADVRLMDQNPHPGPDSLYCALRSKGIPGCKEAVEPLHIGQRRRRPDQTWHLGGSASSPASSFANQSSASSSVRCKPVCWYACQAQSASCLKASRFSSRSTYCRRLRA